MIFTSMGFMRVNNTWPAFVRIMDRAFPKIGDTYALALDDDALNSDGPTKPDDDKEDDDQGGSPVLSN